MKQIYLILAFCDYFMSNYKDQGPGEELIQGDERDREKHSVTYLHMLLSIFIYYGFYLLI